MTACTAAVWFLVWFCYVGELLALGFTPRVAVRFVCWMQFASFTLLPLEMAKDRKLKQKYK